MICLIILILSSCENAELYLISPSNDNNDLLNNCDSLKIKLTVLQDTVKETEYFTVVKNGNAVFNLINDNKINLNRRVSLKLVILNENTNPSCTFKENQVYTVNNIFLKKLQKQLNIYEIELSNFYRVN